MKTTQKSMKSVKIWADNEKKLMKSVKILPHNEKNNEKKIILQQHPVNSYKPVFRINRSGDIFTKMALHANFGPKMSFLNSQNEENTISNLYDNFFASS